MWQQGFSLYLYAKELIFHHFEYMSTSYSGLRTRSRGERSLGGEGSELGDREIVLESSENVCVRGGERVRSRGRGGGLER